MNDDKRGGMFLSFKLSDESYGIEILKVREIIALTGVAITPVPKTPDHSKGVINLRGKIIPIIDLRTKLGMASVEITRETCIIVVTCQNVDRGLIVDRMSEVVNIPHDQVEPAPSFGPQVDTQYLLGIGKLGQRTMTLLNIDELLKDEVQNDLARETLAA